MQQQLKTTLLKSIIPNLLITLGLAVGISLPALARENPEQLVNSIRSVEQVKEDLKNTFQRRDECPGGSCWNSTSSAICATVAALDVQVNGQILNDMILNDSEGNIPINQADLDLMKLIFSQCKPTNYQYWNWPMMLHVVYAPSDEADEQIRRGLGLPPQP